MRVRRKGFSLPELLVVIGIISVLMSILLPAIQKARESASLVRCTNNLHQIGIALHVYNEAAGTLPPHATPPVMSNPPQWVNMYRRLLPYIEEGSNDGTKPIALFYCPTRRTINAGTRDDYGAAWFLSVMTWKDPKWHAIIETYSYIGVPLERVSQLDGTSNTLLLTHKGVDPLFYYSVNGGNGVLDEGWSNATDEYDMGRYPCAMLRDTPGGYSTNVCLYGSPATWTCDMFLTSPHPNSMPSLMADGSVKLLPYSKVFDVAPSDPSPPAETVFLSRLWCYNDGQAITVE